MRGLALFASVNLLFITPLAYGQGDDNPTGPTGSFSGNIKTGCSIEPYVGNGTRAVGDLSVPGAVGGVSPALVAYPEHLDLGLLWQRFRPGGNWRHSYSWGLTSSQTVVYPDGRIIDLSKATSDPNLTGD